MKSRKKAGLSALVAIAWCGMTLAFFPSALASSSQARIEGVVTDAAGNPLPGALVELYSARDPVPMLAATDGLGVFRFETLPSGSYTPVAKLDGYHELVHSAIEIEDGETVRVRITLQLAYSEELLITEELVAPEPNRPQETEVLPVQVLELLPLENDRFTEALPLLPGVVRGPGGRLSFNGARASQSVLLVNGSNVTDPLTGEFAIDLPMKAIDTVEVHRIPYSAEYGRVTAAVAEVTTRAGSDEWDVDFSNLWPSLRWRNGKIAGINSATPRTQVSGPLKKGKVWFSQGFGVRFVRSRVYGLTEEGADEQILENFDTFTQLDFKLGDAHNLTTTFSYFPVKTENLGLDTLHPEKATPDFQSWGWNFAARERATLSPRLFIETTFAVKTFDVAVRPKARGTTRLTPDGLRDNYFNELNRESTRWDLNFACTHSIGEWHGQHVMKFGTNIAHMRFEGTDEGSPVEVLGSGGQLLRRIEFRGDPRVAADSLEVSGYIQDQWRPTSRLGLDVGLRFDYERLTGNHHLSPRFAAAYSLREDGSTIVKGGVGLFYDQIFLHAGSFERFQQRVETVYGPDGGPVGPPLVFENRIAPEGLKVPRGTSWNVELNQALGRDWLLRVNFRERRGSNEPVVDRVEHSSTGPALVLAPRGRSTNREFDVTVRKGLPDAGELFFSYVKSRTTGDLNNFGTVYQDLREPVLLESEHSLFPFDVPHRLLVWGIIQLPKKITVVPGVEWRQGFPYTVFQEDYSVEGMRNRGGRFPTFLSIDLRVTKEIGIIGRRVRIGFQLFNLTNHFNPRDFSSNLASTEFGTFRNSRGISGGAKLQLVF